MALQPHTYTLLVTDLDLVEIGKPITTWTRIEAEKKFNEPGFGSFDIPATADLIDQCLTPGRRAVLIRDGAYFVGGPIEQPAGSFEWTADRDGAGGAGELTVAFTDDLLHVINRITLPNAAKVPEDTTQPAYRTFTATAAGTVMTTLVDENCVSATGVVAYRVVPSLAIGAGAGVGTSISFSTRFEPLGDALRSAAIAGGGLGFRTVQGATTVDFEVYATVDRTKTARFSRSVGNLRGFTYDNSAPVTTHAIVGGGGEGDARLIVRRTNATATAAWWLAETFVDQRDTSDTTELEQSGDEELEEAAETAKLTLVAVETPHLAYGDFELGDTVTCELYPGVELAEVVRGVHLEVDADGELLDVLVGSTDASADPDWIREVRRITRSVRRLEVI